MANRYANLVGSNKISDEWQKINDGFDAVEQEMDDNKSEVEDHIGSRGDAHASATQTEAGFMSAADKTKLNQIEAGAQKNQDSFSKVNDVEASDLSDSLIIEGSVGITVTTNPTEKKVILTATGDATPGAHGSSHNSDGADPIPDLVALQQQVDNLELSADNVTLDNPNFTSVTVDGGMTELFTSVSDGKTLLASVITDKGVETDATNTFQQMADNILKIDSRDDYDFIAIEDPILTDVVGASIGSVAYGKGIFVAVGSAPGFNAHILVSEDGENWTEADTYTGSSLKNVNYDEEREKFIAVGSSDTILTSDDGYVWEKQMIPEQNNDWMTVASGGGLIIAVTYSFNDAAVITSSDGENWTLQNPIPGPARFESMAYGAGKFVLVSEGNVLVSTDGASWVNNSPDSSSWRSVIHDGEKFIVLPSQMGTGDFSIYSYDGENWEQGGQVPRGYWNGIAYGRGYYLAVSLVSSSQFNPNHFITSADGINWRLVSLPDMIEDQFGNYLNVTYGKGRFVAVGQPLTSGPSKILTFKGLISGTDA